MENFHIILFYVYLLSLVDILSFVSFFDPRHFVSLCLCRNGDQDCLMASKNIKNCLLSGYK